MKITLDQKTVEKALKAGLIHLGLFSKELLNDKSEIICYRTKNKIAAKIILVP